MVVFTNNGDILVEHKNYRHQLMNFLKTQGSNCNSPFYKCLPPQSVQPSFLEHILQICKPA